MGRNDALIVGGRGVSFVVPRSGEKPFYLRAEDGACGRKLSDGDMMWIVRVDGEQVVATELVDDAVVALDRVVARMQGEITAFRRRGGR